MIGGLQTYKTYLAIKSHFLNNKYDFFKYHGKTRVPSNLKDTFDTKKYAFKYQKLGKLIASQDELELYLAINMFDDVVWIDDLLSDASQERFSEFQKTDQALSYIFENEIRGILDRYKFPELFASSKDGYPPVVKLLLANQIRLHTFLILDDCVGIVTKMDKEKNDVIWSFYSKKLKKIRPFIKYDLKKMQAILKKAIEDHI